MQQDRSARVLQLRLPALRRLQSLADAWVAKQPGDVVVKKVPITFGRAAWANIAKLYYTLEITGDLHRLEAMSSRPSTSSARTCSRKRR
jgi:hypothetical protein